MDLGLGLALKGTGAGGEENEGGRGTSFGNNEEDLALGEGPLEVDLACNNTDLGIAEGGGTGEVLEEDATLDRDTEKN